MKQTRSALALAWEPNEQEVQARIRPELLALATDEVLEVNLNVPAAVSTVLGVVPRVRGLRGEIARRLPDFDLARLDRLEDYAITLNATHAEFLAARGVTALLPELVLEARGLRATLRAEARAWVARGYLAQQQLAALSKKHGYLNLVNDLGILVSLFTDPARRAPPARDLAAAEVARARDLIVQILSRVNQRHQPSPKLRNAASLRARAFTLLLRAYDEVRRAVCYLEWSTGNAERIAPSLRGAAGRKRRQRVEAVRGVAIPETPAQSSLALE